MATNPWANVPSQPDYVLPEDAAGARPFALSVLPGPWSGPALTARVLLLLLNPGYEPGRDERDLEELDLRILYRSQTSGLAPFPWHLPRWARYGGGEYWGKLLRRLTEDVGPEAVATGLASVQWLSYHSTAWVEPAGPIPSQKYTARVIRYALNRGALLVIARSWPEWTALVGEELTRAPVIHLRNHRRPYLTPGNMGTDAYGRLIAALAASR